MANVGSEAVQPAGHRAPRLRSSEEPRHIVNIQVPITIDTNPSGLLVWYNGSTPATAPVNFMAEVGVTYMLITKSPQPDSPIDTRYKFNRWVAGPNTWGWNVTVAGPATYTASFNTQYLIQISSNIPGPWLNIDLGDCSPVPPASGPMLCWETANSNPTIILSTPQTPVPGSQYVFAQWSDGGLNPVRAIGPITGPATYLSMWTAQYYLTMALDTNCQGMLTPLSGWRPLGDTVNIDWTSPAVGAGERWTFDHWEGTGIGSYSGTNVASSVVMNDPMTQTAFCRQEFRVTVTTSPAGRIFEVNGTVWTGPRVFWWEYLSQHYINVTSTTQPDLNPETRYVFTGWADGYPNANRPLHTVIATATLTANFKTQHHITLEQAPVTPTGLGGLQCNGAADCWFDQATSPTVSLTSPYPAGALYIRYQFQSWSGDASGTAQSFTFTSLDAPKTAIANWAVEYKVTVMTAYETATCSPAADCWFQSGAVATLSVPAMAGDPNPGRRHRFVAWTGDASSSTNPLTMLVDSHMNLTAVWLSQSLINVISVCGTTSDCGTPVGSGWHDESAALDISVTSPWPATAMFVRYNLVRWTGDGPYPAVINGNPVRLTVSGPGNITAVWMVEYKVTVTTPQGIASCLPNPSCWLQTGDAALNLSETLLSGGMGVRYVFTAWAGDATGTDVPLSIYVARPMNVTAEWKSQYLLAIMSECGGVTDCGSPSGAGWYDGGAKASVSISTPFTDTSGRVWDLTIWDGDVHSTNTTLSVEMVEPREITANWAMRPPADGPPGVSGSPWLLVVLTIVIVVMIALLLVWLSKRRSESAGKEQSETRPEGGT